MPTRTLPISPSVSSRFFLLPLLLCFVLLGPPAHASIVVVPGSETQLAADAAEDIEPTVVSQLRGADEYTIAVNMKFQPTANSAGGAALLWATVVSPAGVTTVPIPSTASYDHYADPVLAKDDGAPGQPLYLVALSTNGGARTAILSWTSTNGGFSWSGPNVVDSRDSDATHEAVDKPWIVAGLPTGPRLTRMIYATYIVYDTPADLPANSGKHEVKISSSSSGLLWSTPVSVSPKTIGGFASYNQAPVAVGDTTNGIVYVVWARAHKSGVSDLAEGIHVKQSSQTYPTLIFGSTEWNPYATDLYDPDERVTLGQDPQTRELWTVRAASIPIARFDSVHKRMTVVWHDHGNPGFTRLRVAASLNGRPWQADILTDSSHFDLQPTFDVDPDGNCLVTYYHFVGTPGNETKFQQAGTFVTFPDQLQPAHEDPSAWGPTSDILGYVSTGNGRLLGEYHDISYSNGNFKAVGIVIGATGDPWLWKLTHP
jgi:hypothetical protein